MPATKPDGGITPIPRPAGSAADVPRSEGNTAMRDPIVLAEKPGSAAANALAAALRARLGQPVGLDGRHVRGRGGRCAQILLAAVRRWRADGQEIDILASEQMRGDLMRMGLADEILGRGRDG